jgi:integrase
MKLARRGSVYQFRKAVPKVLRPIVGAGDIRCSLATSDVHVARQRAHFMYVKVDEIFHILRAETPRPEAQRLAIKLLEQAMTMVRGTPASFHRQMTELKSTIAVLRSMDDSNTVSLAAIEDLEQRLSRQLTAAVAEGHKARFSPELLSTKIGEYKTRIAAELSGKHADDVPRRLDFFLSVVGDMPVRDLKRSHIKDFRNVVDQLPKNLQKGLSTSQALLAIAKNTGRSQPVQVIDSTTVDLKYIGPVRRFLDELANDGDIERNPALGIHSARTKSDRKKAAANTKRSPFTIAELNKILQLTSKLSRATAEYWTPPCLLFTGMRLNEFAQLRTSDLIEHNGRPHLSVVCVQDQEEDEDLTANGTVRCQLPDERRVKSASARRFIPIHPTLIEFGFLDFIRSRVRKGGAASIFRECKPDKYGYYSGPLGKRLNGKITKAGVKKTRQKSVYSLRHNFSDACDSGGIPERTKNKFMGHLIAGTAGIYGNSKPEPNESPMIEMVKYVGLDFSPYKRSSAAP